MEGVSVDLLELDERTTAIEALAKRVRLTVERGSLEIRLWISLVRALRAFRTMGAALSRAEVVTAEDRALMAEVARGHARCATTLRWGRDRLVSNGDHSTGVFRRRNLHLMDTLLDDAGDLAETAALSASAGFARLVDRELAAHREARPVG